MILRVPSYYRRFRCRADRCSDSCCIGWEIDIDSKSMEYYKSADGEFGERLKKNISEKGTPHFILDKNERCPFLNDRNLCDVYINMGEDRLCNICTDHPRFFEWYNEVKEGGIGLCCEAAAEIILTENEMFSYYDIQIPFEECSDYDDNCYDYLFEVRNKLTALMQRNDIEFGIRLESILEYAAVLQSRYDNFDFEITEASVIRSSKKANCKKTVKNILNFFEKLEILNKGNNLFKEAAENTETIFEETENFFRNYPEVYKYLENVTVYFIWRYFLKSTFDDEFYSKIAFAVTSTVIIGALFINAYVNGRKMELEEYVRNVVYYSKEIEYSEENMNNIFDAFYENDDFTQKKLSEALNIF